MSEEKKEIAVVDKDKLAALREGSGESNAQRPFIPILQVDNTKELTKLPDGREVDALCDPRWKRVDRDESGEYKTTTLKSFGGVVLKIMWQVANNGKWDPAQGKMVSNGAPFFSSSLFNPSVFLGHGLVNIKYADSDNVEAISYRDLKVKYPELFKLTGWMFVLHNNEVVRLKITGASRGPLFDYLKTFKANDSISAHPTVFAAEYIDKPQPHNKAKFSIATDPGAPYDIDQVLKYQDEINSLFNSAAQQLAESMGGEVIEDSVIEDEIKVEDVKFD